MKLALSVSPELERGLLSALLAGELGLDQVPQEALSRPGQDIWQTVEYLQDQKATPPYDATTVATAATDILGHEKDSTRAYVEQITGTTRKGAAEILQTLQEQNALNEVANEAAKQMASKQFDPSAFTESLGVKTKNVLVPACDLLKDNKLPEIPVGVSLSLPMLTEVSGGVFGFWAIGGKSGAGKSTLGVQVSLEVAATGKPVLYYDMENGEAVLMYRIGQAFGMNISKVQAATKHLYLRHNIRSLSQDIRSFKVPVLVVVDSVQKLPTQTDQRRNGIDAWLHKFERMKHDGHSVLLISELNGMGGYKETGEIEYTADFGCQLVQNGDATVDVKVVKNRHRPATGIVCTLERVNDWLFREADSYHTPRKSEAVDL